MARLAGLSKRAPTGGIVQTSRTAESLLPKCTSCREPSANWCANKAVMLL